MFEEPDPEIEALREKYAHMMLPDGAGAIVEYLQAMLQGTYGTLSDDMVEMAEYLLVQVYRWMAQQPNVTQMVDLMEEIDSLPEDERDARLKCMVESWDELLAEHLSEEDRADPKWMESMNGMKEWLNGLRAMPPQPGRWRADIELLTSPPLDDDDEEDADENDYDFTR